MINIAFYYKYQINELANNLLIMKLYQRLWDIV